MKSNQSFIQIEDNSINGSENTYGQPGFQNLEGKYWGGYGGGDKCSEGDSDLPDLSQCFFRPF